MATARSLSNINFVLPRSSFPLLSTTSTSTTPRVTALRRFAIPIPRNMSSSSPLGSLNIDNINPRVKQAQYAVRGELAVRAEKYRAQLASDDGPGDLPFDAVISANIGNPQQLDQKPITFFRQVASLMENPLLLEHEQVLVDSLGYKSDVIERAKWLLKDVKGVGAYSQSQGTPGIRGSIAKFIESQYSPQGCILYGKVLNKG